MRTNVPVAPVQAATAKTLFAAREKEFEPKWVCAEGFAREGSTDAQIVMMRILIERSAEWNEQLWVLNIDLSDDFGFMDGEVLGRALEKRIRAFGAFDILSTMT